MNHRRAGVCGCVYVWGEVSFRSGVAFKKNFMPDWSRPLTQYDNTFDVFTLNATLKAI